LRRKDCSKGEFGITVNSFERSLSIVLNEKFFMFGISDNNMFLLWFTEIDLHISRGYGVRFVIEYLNVNISSILEIEVFVIMIFKLSVDENVNDLNIML
jgi:hypothetical protein